MAWPAVRERTSGTGEELARTPRPPSPDGAALGAVLAVWAGCSAVAASLVMRFGRRLPYSDDWQIVPYVSGDKPVTFGWLWRQHNEHRIPLLKAVHVVLLRAFDFDYRAPVMVNLVALALLALALIRVARRLRGGTRLSDAAIPLLLLSPHLPPLHWGVQMQFTGTALALGLVLLAARPDGPGLHLRGSADLVLWSAAQFLLATSGVNGLVLVPLIAGALLLAAARARAMSSRIRAVAVVVALAGLAAVPLYFVGFHATANGWGHPGPATFVSIMLRLAGGPLGPALHGLWPLAGVAVIAVAVPTAVAVVRRQVRPPAPVLLVVAAEVVLAAAVAYGRGGKPWGVGEANHYEPLFLALIVAVLLIWAPKRALLARAVPAVFASVLAVLYAGAVADAVHDGRQLRAGEATFSADARAGTSPAELAARHTRLLYFVDNAETRGLVRDGLPDFLCATGSGPCP